MPKKLTLEQGCKNTCSLMLQNSMFTLVKMTLVIKEKKALNSTQTAKTTLTLHLPTSQAQNFS